MHSVERVAYRWLTASRIEAPPAMLEAIVTWIQAQVASEALRDVERLKERNRQPGRYQEVVDFLGQEFADSNLVDIVHVERLARQYGGRVPTGPKPKTYEQKFPLDLAGWRHERLVESGRKADLYRMLDPITVVWYTSPAHAPSRVRGPGGVPNGTWDSIGLLRVYMGGPPVDSRSFVRRMGEIARVVRHELQHLSQTVLEYVSPTEGAGMPSGGQREHSTPHDEAPGSSEEHALRDVEFYTRLQDSIEEFEVNVRPKIGPARDSAAVRLAIRVVTGVAPAQAIGRLQVGPDPFFEAMRRHDPAKWRKAVGEFTAAVLERP